MSILPFLPYNFLEPLITPMVSVLQVFLVECTAICLFGYGILLGIRMSRIPMRPVDKGYLSAKYFYNWFQVLFNLVMVLYACYSFAVDWPLSRHLWLNVDSNIISFDAQWFVTLHAWNKLLDLLDTYFIVREGKWERASFLHCYHHLCIVSIWVWLATTQHAVCRPTVAVGAILNSFIHMLMYGYYALSTNQKYGPWVRRHKLWLTKAQMFQFLLGCLHALAVAIWDTECNRARWSWVIQFGFLAHMFWLFAQFFRKELQKKHFITTSKQ